MKTIIKTILNKSVIFLALPMMFVVSIQAMKIEPTGQEQPAEQQQAMSMEEEQAGQPGVPMSPESGSGSSTSDSKSPAMSPDNRRTPRSSLRKPTEESPGTARSSLRKPNGESPGTDRRYLNLQFQPKDINRKENKDPVASFYHACRHDHLKDVLRLMSENNNFSHDILQCGVAYAERAPYVKLYLSNIIKAFQEHALFDAITAKNVRLERRVADLEQDLEDLKKAKANNCVVS